MVCAYHRFIHFSIKKLICTQTISFKALYLVSEPKVSGPVPCRHNMLRLLQLLPGGQQRAPLCCHMTRHTHHRHFHCQGNSHHKLNDYFLGGEGICTSFNDKEQQRLLLSWSEPKSEQRHSKVNSLQVQNN